MKTYKEVKIKRIKHDAIIPTQGDPYSAGYDLYACGDYLIQPHTSLKISTGLQMELPNGYFGAIFARSGLASKQGLRPSNAVGVCDESYRGEYIVSLYNDSNEPQIISNGDKVAQLILLPYQHINFKEVEELSETKRGDGGFGSTGK